MQAAGALPDAGDMAAMRARIAPPISVPYRDFELRQTPPNSMGFAMLQMLRIFEQFDLGGMEWGSAALIHLMVEAKKRAFLDREAHAGSEDPPLEMLLSASRAAEHAAMIGPRAVLTRMRPGLAAAKAVPFNIPRVSALSGAWMLTTSARAIRASSECTRS